MANAQADGAPAKPPLSFKLRQMKFMQRREEQRTAEAAQQGQAAEPADADMPPAAPPEAGKQEPANPEHWHVEPSSSTARCRVIFEGDPQPAQAGCRMHFTGSVQAAPDPEIERLAQIRKQAPSNHADRFFSEPAERPAGGKQAASKRKQQQHAANTASPASKQRKASGQQHHRS